MANIVDIRLEYYDGAVQTVILQYVYQCIADCDKALSGKRPVCTPNGGLPNV